MSDEAIHAKQTPAWRLPVSEHLNIAVGDQAVAEYLQDAEFHSIPGAVAYCKQMLLWRNGFIPVMDLNLLLTGKGLSESNVAVIGYQDQPQNPVLYVAIKLHAQVEKIMVSDGLVVDWPEDYPKVLEPLVTSLFNNEGAIISVISIADLCNPGFAEYAAYFI